MWFAIKWQSSCKEGSKHFHQKIIKSRYFNHKYKKINDLVIHRNSYFSHRKNVILAMIVEHRPHTQEVGFRRLMKVMVLNQSGKIRKFKVPSKFNLDATEYFEMIDWTNVVITEPPEIKTMTDADLRKFIAI